MLKTIYEKFMFHLISALSIKRLPVNEKTIFLTFDDGPEPEITENIINILNSYNAKATFFCTGKNYLKFPKLITKLKENGHNFGNHTFSHINGLYGVSSIYIKEVLGTREIVKTNLFRPPWGALSIKNYLSLKKTNKIVMWKINSNDSISNMNWDNQCYKMIKRTKPGSIILFHFCQKHANETLKILPKYLQEAAKKGYSFKFIEFSTLKE